MNYQRIYDQLMLRAQGRKPEPHILYDRHHIIPKSLGGSNYSSNIARLTLREHFIAHRVLVKIYANQTQAYKKMVYALWWMSKTKHLQDSTIVSSHSYEQARLAYMSCHPQKDPTLKATIRSRRDQGVYNYDYKKVSQTLSNKLKALSSDHMTRRLENSLKKANPEQRAQAIKQGKASKYRLIEMDGSVKEFWSYDDVEAITGVKYTTILVRVRNHKGILTDGRKVEVIVKKDSGNTKKIQSKYMLHRPDGSTLIFDKHDDVKHLIGYSYNHIIRVIRRKEGLLSNGSRVSCLQRYMGRK